MNENTKSYPVLQNSYKLISSTYFQHKITYKTGTQTYTDYGLDYQFSG